MYADGLPPVPPDGTPEERQEAFEARRLWRAKRDEEIRAKIKRLKRNIRRLSIVEAYGLLAILEERCPELIRLDDDRPPGGE